MYSIKIYVLYFILKKQDGTICYVNVSTNTMLHLKFLSFLVLQPIVVVFFTAP